MVAAASIATSDAVGPGRPFNSIRASRGSYENDHSSDCSSAFDFYFAEIIEKYEVVMPIITMKDSHLVSIFYILSHILCSNYFHILSSFLVC